MFGFLRKTQEIHGVKFWLNPDVVEGYTDLIHPSDKFQIGQKGVFPYMQRYDNGKIILKLRIESGFTMSYSVFQAVVLRAGNKATFWNGEIKKHSRSQYSASFHIDVECDQEWRETLAQLGRSDAGIVRFRGELENQHLEFAVKTWNVRLVAEIMGVYEKLAPKTARPAAPPTGPGPTSIVLSIGPFGLSLDGSIAVGDTTNRLPPGIAINDFEFGGHTIRSQMDGSYIIVKPDGTSQTAEFVGGRWRYSVARAGQ